MKTPDHGSKNISEDPKSSTIAVIGVVGAVLIFVIIVWLQAVFYRVEEAEIRRKNYARVPEEMAKLRAEQQENLNRFGWVDEKGGVVSIPIDRAMEAVVREMAGNEGEGR